MNQLDQVQWDAFRRDPTEASFRPLYEASRSLVWTICFRLLRSEEDALDAFQSAYARLLALARDVTEPEARQPIRETIVRLAGREADALRKRRNRRSRKEASMDAACSELDKARSASASPAEEAQQHQMREKIEMLIATLPDAYRDPLVLHYFHGMTHREIALALGRREGTISMQLHRGLRRLAPLARRAGLGNLTAAGLAIGVYGLIEPGGAAAAATLTSTAVFAQAQATLVAGSAAASAIATGKLSLGVTIVKSKLALATAILVLIAGGATIWKVGAGPQKLRTAQAARSDAAKLAPGLASPRFIGAAATRGSSRASTSTLVTNSAAAIGGAAESATQRPNSEAPAPAGPRRDVAVSVEWADTQAGIAGVEVTAAEPGRSVRITNGGGGGMSSNAPSPQAWRARALTDAKGQATLSVPESWARGYIVVAKADIVSQQRLESLPPSNVVTFFVDHGATVFGSVKNKATGDAVAGASVTVSQILNIARGVGGMSGRGVGGAPAVTPIGVTDAQGQFEITGLATGQGQVSAQSPTMRMSGDTGPTVDLKASQRTGPVDLVLAAGTTLSGVVTDSESNQPVAGATITVTEQIPMTLMAANPSPTPVVLTAQSDQNGAYHLDGVFPSMKSLHATHPAYADRTDNLQIAEGAPSTKNIQLDGATTITVQVVDDKSQPLAEARVMAPERQPNTVIMREYGSTDEHGMLVVGSVNHRDLPILTAAKDGFEYQRTVNGGQPAQTIQMKAMQLERAIHGQVTDAAGKPIAGITIADQVWPGMLSSPLDQAASATSDDQGNYQLAFNFRSDKVNLVASGSGWATQTKAGVSDGTPDSPATVNFVMDSAHYLEGRVLDEQGEPIEDVRLSASNIAPDASNSNGYSTTVHSNGSSSNASIFNDNTAVRATSDSSGHYRLDGLIGPQVALAMNKPGYSRFTKTIAVDQAIDLTMLEMGTIKGRVIDHDTQQPVTQFTTSINTAGYIPPRHTPGETFNDAQGRFTLATLQRDDAGLDFTIHAAGYLDGVEKAVAVQPDAKATEQIFELSHGTGIDGVVVDATTGAPIAGAQVALATLPMRRIVWSMLLDSNRPPMAVPGYPTDLQLTTTQPDGTFHLSGTPGATLFVHASGYARRVIAADDRPALQGSDNIMHIPLHTGVTLSGTVAIQGWPARINDVSLQRSLAPGGAHDPWQDEVFEAAPLGSAASFKFDNLDPGNYEVMAYAQILGPTMAPAEVIYRAVTVGAAGATNVTVGDGISPLHLRAAVQTQATGVMRLEILPQFASPYAAFSEQIMPGSGTVQLWGMPPGNYQMRALSSSVGGGMQPLGPLTITGDTTASLSINLQ